MTTLFRAPLQSGVRRLAGRATLTLAAAFALAAAMLLTGCAGQTPADYASQTPVLDLRQYFNGKLLAHGIATDRSGKVLQRFTVQMTGSWQGDEGRLDEQFSYSDGRREQRIWKLNRQADGRYTGRAADVLGEARGHPAATARCSASSRHCPPPSRGPRPAHRQRARYNGHWPGG